MAKQRILFFSQEIAPYLPSSENSKLGKELPVAMQGRKFEVRTFMPNFGAVNERRNQLHEVIRLSGVNIVINDADHPLIIKVASMQPSRIQVYFVDNDDYFQKSDEDIDDIGSNRPDNDERAIFYAKGAVETAEKLKWEPDMIQVSGWISALIPLYIRRVFNTGPDFKKAKIVYTVLRQGEMPPEEVATEEVVTEGVITEEVITEEVITEEVATEEMVSEEVATEEETPKEPVRIEVAPIDPSIFDKLAENGVKPEEIEELKKLPFDSNILHRIAIKYSDGVVFNTTEPDPELVKAAEEACIPYIALDPEANNAENYFNFYQSLKAE